MKDNIFSVLFFEGIITVLLIFGSTWPEVVKKEQGGKPHTTEACRPRLTFPPARRAPATPLTPRPTAFHSPASIRRFPPGTRHRYVRVWQPD